MLLSKYPYTDFHELNLDFILHDIKELIENQKKFKLAINGNKLQLLDPEGVLINEVTISYSEEASHATSANNASTAQTAVTAEKDENGNDLTSYVKTVESSGNLITFKNGDNNTVASVSVTTGDITIVDLVTPEETASVYGYYFHDLLDALTVDGMIALTSNYTAGQISTLMQNGNGVYIRHIHNRAEIYDALIPITMNSTLYFIYDLKTFKIIPNNETSIKIQRVN